MAAKDNRLKPFDQILEINGQKITPDLNGEQVQRAVKQLQQKVSVKSSLKILFFYQQKLFFFTNTVQTNYTSFRAKGDRNT